MAPNMCGDAYPLSERQKPYLLEREEVAKCAKGIQNAHFRKGQQLAESPARKEKHAKQETPLHYTH